MLPPDPFRDGWYTLTRSAAGATAFITSGRGHGRNDHLAPRRRPRSSVFDLISRETGATYLER